MPNGFQVAPIHAFAKERDDVLRKEWCPQIQTYQTAATTDPKWKSDIMTKYGNALYTVWNKTHLNQEPLDIDQAAILIDGINSLSKNKTTLPTDIQAVLTDLLAFLRQYEIQQWSQPSASTMMTNGILGAILQGFNKS